MVDIVFVTEMVQLIYKIPSTFLMILSVYVILKEFKKKNIHFNKPFYFIIVCKLINEIIHIITNYVLVKLPKWGFFNNIFEENDWIASMFYVLSAQQAIFMFLLTFLVSINRYVAVKCPIKYQDYFSRSNRIKILIIFIIFSSLIGLGNISFKPVYRTLDFAGAIIPYFTLKEVIYYQIFCTVFLFGTLSITTCIFNLMAILELEKRKQLAGYFKRDRIYIIYSIFIFITLSLFEAFFVIRVIAIHNDNKLLHSICIYYHTWAFDLPSLGDFYFFIFSSVEVRSGIKKLFKCSKKVTTIVHVKIVHRR